MTDMTENRISYAAVLQRSIEMTENEIDRVEFPESAEADLAALRALAEWVERAERAETMWNDPKKDGFLSSELDRFICHGIAAGFPLSSPVPPR